MTEKNIFSFMYESNVSFPPHEIANMGLVKTFVERI